MAQPVKGTVTNLSSIFPAEEAQKAAKRVHDAIAERRTELESLHAFISDNNNLVNLVQRLPDELHHDIMVPFGKAAFFPGQLIHTNEFLVLLGEGYYAERTSKQTIEILKRRGKALDSHVDSLKAVMQDLKAEASFFDVTADEAAEGVIEIREDVEENSSEMVSKTDAQQPDSPLSKADSKRVDDEDEQYVRILSRLDELEIEELAAESVDIDEHEDAKNEADVAPAISQSSLEHDYKSSKGQQFGNQPPQAEDEFGNAEEISCKKQQHVSDQLNVEDLMVQPASKGSGHDAKKSSSTDKGFTVPEVKENVQAVSSSKKEVLGQTTKPRANSLKAFPGSIIEHSYSNQTNSRDRGAASTQSSSSQLSKPVSRFKLQRR